jgi:TetR/AcrR family transcriptional regulator, transcriptional repressor for nem operon
MGHPVGKKEESRAKILASAGRGFRAHGFGGLGVDGLAKDAGVTSGAFYAHFKSKSEAFRDSVHVGMREIADGVTALKSEGGNWVERFIDFYLGPRRDADLSESCALQSLTNEVARADEKTRDIYGTELEQVIAILATGMSGENAEQQRAEAIALLALLSGGVSMVRAVNDVALAGEIISAVRRSAKSFQPAPLQRG